jgi:hypothetical protein
LPKWPVAWLVPFGVVAIVSAAADVVAGVMAATAAEKTLHIKSFLI